MSQNEYKKTEEEPKPRKKKRARRRQSGTGRAFRSILDGSVLTRELAIRLLPFVLFFMVLCVAYIANSYYAEKTLRKINRVRHELRDLENQYIYSKSQQMMYSRRSNVAAMIDSSGFIESLTPPKKIIVTRKTVSTE
jgi:hypothetical protein